MPNLSIYVSLALICGMQEGKQNPCIVKFAFAQEATVFIC